ncbi:cytochrome c biogenesis protein [Cupriavidus sp. TA19]|uniref:cytochrome c-type biogenesis protein n=1 Tax=unclassified Cupriavidus TaxID=2640874 RepID=UPI000E2F1F57|nr:MULTISPECIES: cytochrome c-type biogenesis protein [unclassified Cupriavidus]BDB26636.1 cytochrome c-type biogenesis protein CcmH [Cupriavidus sp. P-10]GLC98095.1 cytochrome c biogenesis protein [Cupriavidus sp. TA19]
MRRLRTALALWLCCLSLQATAAPTEAELDARVHALSNELRCLVCQNQTLADSNADLAVDLRRQIREQLRGGASDQAVKDYLAQRYGDFVLYKPPLRPLTWLLWFGPLLLVAGVAWAIVRARARHGGTDTPLDGGARRDLESLLNDAADPAAPRQP